MIDMHTDLPILAVCYDFDKTLTPDDMQAQGYIQSVGYDVDNLKNIHFDTIVINKYKNDTLIGKEVVQFRVKGIKQSGVSVNDLINK